MAMKRSKAVKVPVNEAERVKREFVERGLFAKGLRIAKEGEFIYFPLAKGRKFSPKYPVVNMPLQQTERKQSFRDLLSGFLTVKEQDEAVKGFDTVGKIAIIEVPPALAKKEKQIARALLDSNKAIKTVLKKADSHSGKYRTQRYRVLAGKRTKTTEYTEHGVRLVFDVEKVYFSVRLSNERKRIAGIVKKGEDVLVMFSGCGPYVLVISKHSHARSVTGIELNRHGHEYAVKNKALNKTENVKFMCGDAKKARQLTKAKFDRIIMPLPKSAGEYLDAAFSVAKDRATIHFYDFKKEGQYGEAAEKVKSAAKKNGFSCRIRDIVEAGDHSPGVHRVCVDAEVNRLWRKNQKRN